MELDIVQMLRADAIPGSQIQRVTGQMGRVGGVGDTARRSHRWPGMVYWARICILSPCGPGPRCHWQIPSSTNRSVIVV